MMDVVDLGQEVGDGELQLVRPQAARLGLGHQPQPRPQILQDVRRLSDDQVSGFEEGRRKRRTRSGVTIEEALHRRHALAAAAQACHVLVVGTGFLQRQAHELSAPLYARPVIQFVSHVPRSLQRSASTRPARWTEQGSARQQPGAETG